MSSILANGREVLARGEYTLRLHGDADPAADEVPVLLVHAALGSWRALCHGLLGSLPAAIAARGCQVFGFDLAGHGLSDPLAEFPDDFLDRGADDVLAVVEALGLPRAGAVVGLGTGALVAALAAARAPERLGALVLDSPPGMVPSVAFEPWDDADTTRPDGYDPLAAWLRLVDGLLRRPVAVPRPPVPALVMAPGGRGGRVATGAAAGGWDVTGAPCFTAPVWRHAPEFFLRNVERFLAVHV